MHRWFAALSLSGLLAGCGTSSPAQTTSSLQGSITVLAAASLTGAFTKIGTDFQSGHPGTAVHYSFAGSATLVAQVQQGAVADVFASADQPNMQKLVEAGLIQGSPSTFARNRLQIVVGAGNPKHITGLSDLVQPGLIVVLCAAAVPCGRYALQALQKAGVTVRPASLETDVKAVTSKVALGEADAGIVYVTDVKAAGAAVQGVDIPGNVNVIATYPVAVLEGSPNVALARAFVDYLDSPAGQRTLSRYGFLGP